MSEIDKIAYDLYKNYVFSCNDVYEYLKFEAFLSFRKHGGIVDEWYDEAIIYLRNKKINKLKNMIYK